MRSDFKTMFAVFSILVISVIPHTLLAGSSSMQASAGCMSCHAARTLHAERFSEDDSLPDTDSLEGES